MPKQWSWVLVGEIAVGIVAGAVLAALIGKLIG